MDANLRRQIRIRIELHLVPMLLAWTSLSFFPRLIGPSLTVLASSVPSAFFQYEPLASSFSAMSCRMAMFAPLVMMVLSVILKAWDVFFADNCERFGVSIYC